MANLQITLTSAHPTPIARVQLPSIVPPTATPKPNIRTHTQAQDTSHTLIPATDTAEPLIIPFGPQGVAGGDAGEMFWVVGGPLGKFEPMFHTLSSAVGGETRLGNGGDGEVQVA